MIRCGRISDANQIINIKIDSWQDTYGGLISNDILKDINYKTEYEKFIGNFNKRKIIVYEENNQILGYAYYENQDNIMNNNSKKDILEIYAIYVKKDYRRFGIGSNLINYILNDMRSAGINTVFLWCVKGNEKAINFYKKNKFNYLKEKKQNYHGTMIEEICFEKKI